MGTKTLAAIIEALFDKTILYVISPYDCIAHIAQSLMLIESTYQHPWTWSLASIVCINIGALLHSHCTGIYVRGDSRMMPDFTQTGKSEDATSTPKNNVPVVVFKNVSKQYGQISALTDISLAISGGVTGILGMNGAGKSTLFKIIMGKIRPSGGQIRLFGEDPWKNQLLTLELVSYQSMKKYDWMTAIDFVTTFARLNGMTREEARLEAERVLTFVELADVMHKQIGRFSKGMRQQVKIAHALVNDPDLIVLDEPYKVAILGKNFDYECH